jgi:autotransporter-associated beta strand protein
MLLSTVGAPAARSLTLGGTNTGNNQIQGVIADNIGTVKTLGVVKSDSGTWILSGANSYSGNTTVNAGTLQLGAADVLPDGTGKGNLSVTGTLDLNTYSETINGLSGAGVVDTVAGGTPTLTVGGNNQTSTFSGVIKNTAGKLALTKTGTGALTLSGMNTYSGNTTVSAGKVIGVVGGSCANSTFILNSTTATCGVSVTSAARAWTNSALTVSAAGVLEYDFSTVTPSPSQQPPLVVNGLADFTATPSVRVIISSALAAGTYPLMTWGSTNGTLPTTANLTVTPFAGKASQLSVSGNTLNLVVLDNVKANNTLDLTNSASWTTSVPTASETAMWDSTVISPNTTSLGSDLAFGGIAILNPGGPVTINAGNTLTLGAAPVDIDMTAATTNLTLNCDLALGAANVWNVATSRTLTMGGVVSGTNTLTKKGAGTVIISGNTTYTGSTTVTGGTVKWTGNRTSPMGGIVDLTPVDSTNVVIDLSGDLPMGDQTFRVGFGPGPGIVTVNHTAGAVTFTNGTMILLGAASTEQGTYNLSGGSITTTSTSTNSDRGIIIGVNTNCNGTFNLSGSGVLTIASGSSLQVSRSNGDLFATNATGTFNQSGGTATVADLRVGGNVPTNNANQIATMNLSGGTFTASDFTALSGGNGSASTIAISGTADVTLPAFPGTRGSGATATITFDGGLLRSAAASANYMSNLTAAYVKAGGARFNTANGDITIAQPLKTDSVSLGGGLTKEGANTLTLTGTNTYTGNTIVSNGTLVIQVASIATNSTVSVAAGAQLQLNFAGGETNIVAAFYTNGVSLPAGVYSAGSVGSFLAGTGSLKLIGGSVPPTPAQLTNSISGSTLTLTWPSGQGWTLKGQTNNLSTGLNTNASAWDTVPGASDGSIIITINPANPTVFYRLFWTP